MREVIPTLSFSPGGPESNDFFISSQFVSFDAAADYITARVGSLDHPVVDRALVDAIVSWLQPEGTDEARMLLDFIRDKWVEPYAMTSDEGMRDTVLQLSDLLSDPSHAQALLRSLSLEEGVRAKIPSQPKSKERASRDGVVSFDEDDLGNATDQQARTLYESVVRLSDEANDVEAPRDQRAV